jgi:hypothetical protein
MDGDHIRLHCGFRSQFVGTRRLSLPEIRATGPIKGEKCRKGERVSYEALYSPSIDTFADEKPTCRYQSTLQVLDEDLARPNGSLRAVWACPISRRVEDIFCLKIFEHAPPVCWLRTELLDRWHTDEGSEIFWERGAAGNVRNSYRTAHEDISAEREPGCLAAQVDAGAGD